MKQHFLLEDIMSQQGINSAKNCLTSVIDDFLTMQQQLDNEEHVVRNRNFENSFFLNNQDVFNVQAKRAVLNSLFKPMIEGIFQKSKHKGRQYLPSGANAAKKIKLLKQHLATISEEECNTILSELVHAINPILNAKANIAEQKENARHMTNPGKRAALTHHSFNDAWFFTFLAKLVQAIKTVLGMKTSAEKILERTLDNSKAVGISLG